MWDGGLARGPAAPGPPPALYHSPLPLHAAHLGAHGPGILLLNLLGKLGDSLWFAQKSFHFSGGAQCLKAVALPFPNSTPGRQASVPAVLRTVSPDSVTL